MVFEKNSHGNNFAMNFAILTELKDSLKVFVRQNILQLDLTKLPKDLLKNIFTVPIDHCPHVKDQHGRFFDIVRSELKILKPLMNMEDFKDIISVNEISEYTLDRLMYAMAHQNQFQLTEDDLRCLSSFLQCDIPNQVPVLEQNVFRKEFKTFKKVVLPNDFPANFCNRCEEWSIIGMIKKIQAKCLRITDGLVGFTVETYEGDSLSVLMEDQNGLPDSIVKEFTVPDGQHIRDAFTRTDHLGTVNQIAPLLKMISLQKSEPRIQKAFVAEQRWF